MAKFGLSPAAVRSPTVDYLEDNAAAALVPVASEDNPQAAAVVAETSASQLSLSAAKVQKLRQSFDPDSIDIIKQLVKSSGSEDATPPARNTRASFAGFSLSLSLPSPEERVEKVLNKFGLQTVGRMRSSMSPTPRSGRMTDRSASGSTDARMPILSAVKFLLYFGKVSTQSRFNKRSESIERARREAEEREVKRQQKLDEQLSRLEEGFNPEDFTPKGE